MRRAMIAILLAVLSGSVVMVRPASAAEYELDKAHTSVYFRIDHFGRSYTYGRFNDIDAVIRYGDGEPGFQFTVKAESVDTCNSRRDDHLRSPDFFNARQFPTIQFTSRSVKVEGDKLEVTGDMTLHGVTKSITFTLTKMGEGKTRDGRAVVGFDTQIKLDRTQYGMDKMVGPVGKDVDLFVSFEAIFK